MRNYFIINGNNSLDLQGFAVNELPPISKPAKRTLIETIDGRDGDIVTDLGYSAYDKSATVGVYGTYDINEIISFFDTEGTIVFSDEPDKYYRFKIINQIDFDELVKFRTANVVFHCQPFKYELNETVVSSIGSNPLVVENKGNIYSKPTFTVYGESSIEVYLNDMQVFTIDLGEEEYITIDIENMEAYKDGILKNRLVTGNYNNFKLNVGENEISFSGTVTKFEISNYSRWL